MIVTRTRTMDGRDIAVFTAETASIRNGSVNGTRAEVITTTTRTRALLPFTRLDMKGATTPVETPVRSSAASAYSGATALKK